MITHIPFQKQCEEVYVGYSMSDELKASTLNLYFHWTHISNAAGKKPDFDVNFKNKY